MITPASERLRALVKEATPGPWHRSEWLDNIYGPPGDSDADLIAQVWPKENARLIALAPQLAELVADMGEALERITLHKKWTREDLEHAQVTNALARLDALFSEEDVT